MGDAKEPSGKPCRIIELRQVLVGFHKHFLANVERILPVRNQPQQVVEDALLPAGYEKVIGLHIPSPGFGDQVAIFNLAEDQLLAPFIKTQVRRKKSDYSQSSLMTTI